MDNNRMATGLLVAATLWVGALVVDTAGERAISADTPKPLLSAVETHLRTLTDKARQQVQVTVRIWTTSVRLLALTNEARRQAHLPPLRANAVLCRVAYAHSANMARQGKMDHILDGKNPFQRLKEAGYRYQRAGENVAAGSASFTPEQVFAAWMNSPAHRKNILHPDYTEMGIGVAVSSTGDLYYTQVFGKPLGAR